MRSSNIESSEQWATTTRNPVPAPAFRRLRGYAFDPSLSTQLDTALVNEVIFRIPWEGKTLRDSSVTTPPLPGADVQPTEGLAPGPVGEYLEVVIVKK